MLGKLIKYELQSSYKLILLTHGFLILLSLIIGTFLAFQTSAITSDYASSFAFSMVAFFAGLLYLPVIAAIVFGTQLYIAVRFYKNLFTDEGYLMHTLPVTPASLIHSKVIVATIWTILDAIIAIICILVLCTYYFAYGLGIGNIFEAAISSFSLSMLPALGYGLIAYISSLLMIFASICLGQLFKKHRGLAAVIIYLALTLIVQSIQSSIILAGNTAMSMVTVYLYTASPAQALSVINVGLTMLVMYVLPAIFFYVLCQYIIHKKLNLM